MHTKSAYDLHLDFTEGRATAVEITSHFLDRSERYNEELGALIDIHRESALARAKELDEKKARGERLGPMAGVPIAVKNNIQLKGTRTTCSSNFLKEYKAPYTATTVQHLLDAGAIPISSTNMDEFAMGSSSEHSAFYTVQNPWDLSRTPGGSSGGSAAAVAARLAPLSLGSDTGGSIRQPAAFTGTVGFKPTYGRVSRYGLVAFGSSFDVVGPFANSVKDVAYIMETMAKPCEYDATSIQEDPDLFLSEIDKSIQGRKIGVPRTFLEGCVGEGCKIFEENLKMLESMGAEIVEITMPHLKYCIPIYYILATAEASTNLARFDGIRYGQRAPDAKTLEEIYDISKSLGFGPEVKQRIMLGTFMIASGNQDAYFQKALKVRGIIMEEFKNALEEVDCIASPTTVGEAFSLDSIHDPVSMYMQDLYTVPANLAGLPAISVPSGTYGSGLPCAIQFTARQKGDATVLNIAHQFEKNRDDIHFIPERYR